MRKTQGTARQIDLEVMAICPSSGLFLLPGKREAGAEALAAGVGEETVIESIIGTELTLPLAFLQLLARFSLVFSSSECSSQAFSMMR